MVKKGKWTPEEDAILRKKYMNPQIYPEEIARELDRAVHSVYGRAKRLGLHAPLERIQATGRRTAMTCEGFRRNQYRKGDIPANKGKKVSPETYEKMKATMYKKGNRPHNWHPPGTERVTVEGYAEVKIADRVWKSKARIVWEAANGPIPPGSVIRFKDGNRSHIELSNLEIGTKSEQMCRNAYWERYPSALRSVIMMKGALVRRIHRIENNTKDTENEQ